MTATHADFRVCVRVLLSLVHASPCLVHAARCTQGIIDGGESKKEPSQQESKLLDEMAGEKKVYKQGYQTLQQLRVR